MGQIGKRGERMDQVVDGETETEIEREMGQMGKTKYNSESWIDHYAFVRLVLVCECEVFVPVHNTSYKLTKV